MNKRPLILVTNDDGITAPGIQTLVKIMKTLGDVVVVAPNSPQSGMGHAITLDSTLHIEKINTETEDYNAYSCSGTPADCVKIAIHEIMDRRPDLVVSGINHGSNSAINVIYSGTMSAAIEAGIEGIPAIGFSLLDYSWNANFRHSEKAIKSIVKNVLNKGLNEGIVLNVNIPNLAEKELKGIKICRQAKSNWKEKFDKRKTPQGKDYYWLTGEFINLDSGDETDVWALENGYISIVPVKFDLTAHKEIKQLKTWTFNE